MNNTRREFIRRTSAILILSGLPRFSRAAVKPALSPLGMGLYGMKSLSVAESLARCARIGYRNVELCIDPEFPGAPAKMDSAARKALRRQADSLGLGFSGMMLNLNLAVPDNHPANLEAIKAAAQLA